MNVKEKMDKYIGNIQIIDNSNNKVLYETHNIVTTGFYTLVSQLMTQDTQPNGIEYLGIGTGTNAESVDNTSLFSEQGSRIQAYSREYNGSLMTFKYSIGGSDAIFTWRELGMFNASSAGVMTNRTVINFTHSAGQSVTIIWNINKA